MSIRYIKNNIEKISEDNIIKFLYDLILYNLSDIEIYNQNKIYKSGEFMYLQESNVHQVFQCIVDSSSIGFNPIEWEHIIDKCDYRPDNITNLIVKEEVHYIEEITNSLTTNLEFIYENSSFAVYCGKKRYVLGYDFIINDNNLTFNEPFNVGDRVILEVREFVGNVIGYVLHSTNNSNYEFMFLDNNLYITESEKHSLPEIFIKDSVTDMCYRLYAIDEDIYYEPTKINATKYEIKVEDKSGETYNITMVNGELYFDYVFNEGLVLKSNNGKSYEIIRIGNELIIRETDNTNAKDAVYFNDNGTTYKLYLDNEIIRYEISNDNVNIEDVNIIDEQQLLYKVEMINREFIVTIVG